MQRRVTKHGSYSSTQLHRVRYLDNIAALTIAPCSVLQSSGFQLPFIGRSL